ncbi:MAG: fumarate hydratase [Chloroflexi bacterium]|nr:MAG: fumarate hydratase [Chloroflexota bacterium]
MMRTIEVREVTQIVAQLCIRANYTLGEDVILALKKALEEEESPAGKQVLRRLLENAEIASAEQIPLCQDTGTAVIFLELGQEVCLIGGDLNSAVLEGVRKGYVEGYLRKSIVERPFSARVNTKDNTPPVIHIEIVPGDRLRVTVLPKGGGSENASAMGMLTPAEGRQGLINFVVQTVDRAGSNPCPPTIVGVGVGGTAEKAMFLAKKALLRRVGEPSADPEVAELERELLRRINALGIGPMGYGGRITALAVHVETMPCHIASLPVAVNLQCHAARHGEVTI